MRKWVRVYVRENKWGKEKREGVRERDFWGGRFREGGVSGADLQGPRGDEEVARPLWVERHRVPRVAQREGV